MTGWRIALALVAVLACTAVATQVALHHEHDAQVAALLEERRAQTAEAVRSIAGTFDDIGDALRLAAELMSRGGNGRDHERELRAILEAVGQMRAIATFRADGSKELLLLDHRASEALAQFEAGVRLLPHDSGPRIELARTLLAAGRAPESLPHFAAALNLAPPDARLRYYHGIALLQSGRGREALAELEAARREDATLPQVDELLDAARAAAAR